MEPAYSLPIGVPFPEEETAARTPSAGRPRVVIVGAGFGGVFAARALASSPADVLLVDRNNYHLFLPLLYQVAAAELAPEDIAHPVRSMLRRLRGASFVCDDVLEVDRGGGVLVTPTRRIPYDYLVLAAGSATHFFGVPGAQELAFPLKTLEEGIALRNHILSCFERASAEPDPSLRRRLLTFCVVGGGATGVEFAGALAELIRGPLARDFPGSAGGDARVVVLEAQDGVLPGMPARLRGYAVKRLSGIGVDVRLRAPVSRLTPGLLCLADGSEIPTETVVWTAGVRGETFTGGAGIPARGDGRIPVGPTLQVAGHPEIYVVGDLSYFEQDGRPLPMVAPVAAQEGTAAARNIARSIAGHAPFPFRYRDPGSMVILGRNAAVARMRGLSLTGFPAWLLWVGVHIFKLIGFRNRLLVLINWAWDYFFFERAVRLILPMRKPGRGKSP